MKILKYRRGFATNSSSSHSIILAGTSSGGHSSYGQEYGWDNFLLSSPEDKLSYMAVALKELLQNALYQKAKDKYQGWEERERIASVQASKLMGVEVDPKSYIDHQSQLGCPKDPKTKKPNFKYFVALAHALANDPTVEILGGNDNDGYDFDAVDHPVICHDFFAPQSLAFQSGGYWVVYNPHNGTKIHLDLSSTGVAFPSVTYTPSVPELVDVKITSHCSMGCSFCYTDSNPGDPHASLEVLLPWFKSCKKAGVLEIAMGGGEPTQHPDFIEILKNADKCFTSVAFTTRDISWLSDAKMVKAVGKYVKAVGWSVSNQSHKEQVLKAWNQAFGKKDGDDWYIPYSSKVPTLVFHFVPDTMSEKTIKEVLRECCYGQTHLYLGYKPTGRGAHFKPTGGAEYLMSQLHRVGSRDDNLSLEGNVAIDTCLASQFRDRLDEMKINPRLYYLEEGRFSMYFDAVESQYGPSSYQPEKLQKSEGLGVQEMFETLKGEK